MNTSERGESLGNGADQGSGPSGGSAATAEMGASITNPGAGDWLAGPVTQYPH